MALTQVTTTFDLSDYFGTDFDARRAKAWATNTAPDQTIHDESTGETRIGSGNGTIGSDGTGSFTHWAPGADANPATWQTYYHFDVPDRNAPRGRRQLRLGPFTVTASGELTALVEEQIAVPTASAAQSAAAAEASATSAAGSATAAQAARAGAEAAEASAQALVLSDLGTTDGQTRALIENPASQTATALNASFAVKQRRIDVPGVAEMAVKKHVTDARFGDGSDNDMSFLVDTTLTASRNYRYVRIASGVTVTVARGVILRAWAVGGGGTFVAEKTNAQNSTGASGGLGGGVPVMPNGGTAAIGGASGQPGPGGGTGAGANGTASAAKITHGGAAGTGGAGGACGATAGGNAGTPGANTTPASKLQTPDECLAAWLTATLATGQGGPSGGAGAGDGTNAGGAGGPGGSAGGFLLAFIGRLYDSVSFTAPGGNGGKGGNGTGGNAGGGGGGAPGGGGIVRVFYGDATGWTGTVTAPAGATATGGAGAGSGAAGANSTPGASGTAAALPLNAPGAETGYDLKPDLTLGLANAAHLISDGQEWTHDTAPVRFVGGPMVETTKGSTTYLTGGLYPPAVGYLGKNNGGSPYVLPYVTDAPVHAIKVWQGNGKVRLKVDGVYVNDPTVMVYEGGASAFKWLQVSFSRVRKLRHFEWEMSGVPFGGIVIGPNDTLYAPSERRDAPVYFLTDSWGEGASGNLNANTWEMGSLTWHAARLLGWDNVLMDSQGGTGYENNGDAPGKRNYLDRIANDLAPLVGTIHEPTRIVLWSTVNDGDTPTLQQRVAEVLDAIRDMLPRVPVWVGWAQPTGSPTPGYLAAGAKIKAAALAAPNVVAFIDGVAGTWYPGPACPVSGPGGNAGSPWVTGTGNVTVPTGVGNADLMIAAEISDGSSIHPSYRPTKEIDGHRYFGTRLASDIAATLLPA